MNGTRVVLNQQIKDWRNTLDSKHDLLTEIIKGPLLEVLGKSIICAEQNIEYKLDVTKIKDIPEYSKLESHLSGLTISSQSFRIYENIRGTIIKSINGRFKLVILVDEKTTGTALKKGISYINGIQERLQEIQGDNPNDLFISLITNYRNSRREGWSYGKIAKRANDDILFCLVYSVFSKESPIAKMNFDMAYAILRAFMFLDNGAEREIIKGRESLKIGEFPLNFIDGPINALKVRDSLEQWEKWILTRRLILKKETTSIEESAELLDLKFEDPRWKRIKQWIKRNMEK
jgi:hypothetical protein